MAIESKYTPEVRDGISRRQFLVRALAAAFTGTVASATAYIEWKTGLPSLIIKDKVPIWIESTMEYMDDQVELTRARFLDESSYLAEQILVKISNEKSRSAFRAEAARVTFVQYKPEAVVSLKPTIAGRRNYLLVDQTGVAGPVAPVSGNYEYSETNGVEQRQIGMQMPAQDENGSKYGPENLVDRLPYNVTPEVNISASGGIVFGSNIFEIVDKDGLEEAKKQNQSYMQAWFTIDEQNEEQVLSQKWTHQRVESEIGNSVYTWSAYIEFTNTVGQKEKGLLVLNGGANRLAVWHLAKICKELSSDGAYKLALMDAGNGNPVYIRPESDSEHFYSIGDYPESAHYSPLSVFCS